MVVKSVGYIYVKEYKETNNKLEYLIESIPFLKGCTLYELNNIIEHLNHLVTSEIVGTTMRVSMDIDSLRTYVGRIDYVWEGMV